MFLDDLVKKLSEYLQVYGECFETATKNCSPLSEMYISGLLKAEHSKRNIERLNEELDMKGDGYQQLQQFITDSTWDAVKLMRKIAYNTSGLYASQPGYDVSDVGYIIDESAHLKKGNESVAVSRQYAGVIGKVENCQVGVYSSLVWQNRTSLINCKLFVPESWAKDEKRCEKAGIPKEHRVHKSKPKLALEMLKADIEAGVRFGWVGGDGLYGHGYELNYAIEDMGLPFVLDVHSDQRIYEHEPFIFIPERKPGAGRTPTRYRTEASAITVKNYRKRLDESQWKEIEVRDTTKGKLKLSVHIAPVWIWDEKEANARKRVIVISQNHADNNIKYSLSNFDMTSTPIERYAYMQAQRYWVERAFQDAKSELGMSDYQVRKWNGWHHHMALVMLASSFILQERIRNKDDCSLLSCRDVRIMIVSLLTGDLKLVKKRKKQMEIRHRQRLKSIERNFKD